MYVVHHAHLACRTLEGQRHLIVAGREQGIDAFQVGLSTLEPGAATVELQHDGQLVALALQGGGKLLVDGGPQRFHAPCSMLIPPGRPYRVANNGSVPLQLVWVCTRPPRAVAPSPESGGPSPDGPWLLQPMPEGSSDGTLADMPLRKAADPQEPPNDHDEDRP
ncbi:MAG: cupin domain-containing protein [Piscinibacter sp.]|nr:cupin domain-containing protein [Piscinibacter sp.]